MIIQSVMRAYSSLNPTHLSHAVDGVNPSFASTVTWRAVVTKANLMSGLSQKTLAKAGMRLQRTTFIRQLFISQNIELQITDRMMTHRHISTPLNRGQRIRFDIFRQNVSRIRFLTKVRTSLKFGC